MILITGASGNVGSEVLKQAAAAQLPIRAAYQTAAKAKAAPAGVETTLLDYNKPETIRAALRGIEIAFLVGPPTANVAELEGQFVDEAKKAGVKRIVKLSAMGGRSAIFPGLHRDSEEKIQASGIPYTFLQPNGFMQNYILYNAATIQGQNAIYGAQGKGAVSHIDIRDIGAVTVKALSERGHEGKAYPLTGPEALNNDQVAEKLSRALGRTIRYVDLPANDFKQALLSAGMPEWSVNAILDLQRMYREGGASAVDPTVSRLLGRPAIPFDQFARDYATALAPQASAAS
ncbi:MAG TPA: SDR family oxidoreductase [Terriglobales bacterium]|nr:SDR family oxidoreductase [Terriglobales bacterium]